MAAEAQTNVQSIDDRLWSDLKQALDSIARHAEGILAQWVVVGERLIELRDRNPGKSGAFGVACRTHGIVLTASQRSAAIWWAGLDDRQRDVLSEKYPDALAPAGLQNRCRETHPQWAKSRKSQVSHSVGNVRNRPQEKKSPLRPAVRAQIEAEVFREELKAKREQRAAAAAAAAANDTRPTYKPGPGPVVMYGVRLWPIDQAERATLGQYDYDQLVTAVLFFIAQRDLVKMPPGDLAANLRLRTRSIHKFVERRLPEHCAQEMRRVLQAFHLICHLHETNPEGECRPPSDRALLEA